MYRDRAEAGQTLADRLLELNLTRPVVFALPRGGVPVAVPVARALNAPLDLLLVRKIGVPTQPELAAGAIVDGPPEHIVYNDDILAAVGLRREDLSDLVADKRAQNASRRAMYLSGRGPVSVAGRSAVVVDDGIATGATMRAAIMAIRERHPAEIILAVPVAATDSLREMRSLVDRVICLEAPEHFRAVGLHYHQFDQVDDQTVTRIMAEAMKEQPDPGTDTQT